MEKTIIQEHPGVRDGSAADIYGHIRAPRVLVQTHATVTSNGRLAFLLPKKLIITIDNMTRAGTAPMATYPNSSSSLYLNSSRRTGERIKKFFKMLEVHAEVRRSAGVGVTSRGKRRRTRTQHRP